MEELTIGKTRIPVTIKRNKRLKSSRLSVDRGGVLVEAPENMEESRIVTFVEKQKSWVFSKWEEVRYKALQNVFPEQFVSGAKIMFLGRMNLIQLFSGDSNKLKYSVRGFEIEHTEQSNENDLKHLVVEFFQEYLSGVMDELIASQETFAPFAALDVRFTRRKDRWAYCDEKNTLHLGWDLAFLPKKLIEYVLVHELCHLVHRNHGAKFWETVGAILPDYDLRQKSLREFEAQIDL
ncbi:MAG: SprT family zinc-dependent metalloprotease [Bdellovibrionota bacterium]